MKWTLKRMTAYTVVEGRPCPRCGGDTHGCRVVRNVRGELVINCHCRKVIKVPPEARVIDASHFVEVER